jgi:hypothetical protein
LQFCVDDILGLQGGRRQEARGNDYKIRHIGKGALLRQGNLTPRIFASGSALAVAKRFMNADEGAVPEGYPNNAHNATILE